MKITKRDRERVAELLSMLACQHAGWPFGVETLHRFHTQFTKRDRVIAAAAVAITFRVRGVTAWRASYAEAEAMIRTGWAP